MSGHVTRAGRAQNSPHTQDIGERSSSPRRSARPVLRPGRARNLTSADASNSPPPLRARTSRLGSTSMVAAREARDNAVFGGINAIGLLRAVETIFPNAADASPVALLSQQDREAADVRAVAVYLEGRADHSSLDALDARVGGGNASAGEMDALATRLRDDASKLDAAGDRIALALSKPTDNPERTRVLCELGRRVVRARADIQDRATRHAGSLPDAAPVSRVDTLDHRRIEAMGVMGVVMGVVEDVEEAATRSCALEAHAVIAAHTVRLTEAGEEAPTTPLADILEDASLPSADGKAKQKARADLVQGWQTMREASGGSIDVHKPWLPLTHSILSEREVLNTFLEFAFGDKAVALPAPELRKLAYDEARARALAADTRRGEPIVKTLGLSGGATVMSRIEPAGQTLLAGVSRAYPLSGFVPSSLRMQTRHVCNLAATTLETPSGTALFRGLRHGVLDPFHLTKDNLNAAPRSVAIESLEGSKLPRNQSAEDFVDGMRSGAISKRAVDAVLSQARSDASKGLAHELVSAALSQNPALARRARAGEVVDVPLSSVSLLTPGTSALAGKNDRDERAMLARQHQALNAIHGATIPVRLRDPDTGTPMEVRVRPHTRAFNFGVNAVALGLAARAPVSKAMVGWGVADKMNLPALEQLLGGSGKDGAIGGDVGRRLDTWRGDAQRLSEQAASSRGFDGAVANRLDREASTLRQREGSLRELATQVRMLRRTHAWTSGGSEPYKTPARVALIAHTMGETPVFNCKSGKDRTGYLDAHVKYLAARQAKEGHWPAPDEAITDTVREDRSTFALHTGNLELQAYNTGLPGYKVKTTMSGAGVGGSLLPSAQAAFLGGSAGVKN